MIRRIVLNDICQFAFIFFTLLGSIKFILANIINRCFDISENESIMIVTSLSSVIGEKL